MVQQADGPEPQVKNAVERSDGQIENLNGNDVAQLDVDDVFVMKTPGGGGYGEVGKE